MNTLTTFKKFPYKATCAIGIVYLINWFVAGLHPNTWEIIGLPLLLYLLISTFYNFVALLGNWRPPYADQIKISFRRFLLCLLIVSLTLPVARFGNYLKTQIFLSKLPRHQLFVDGVIAKEKSGSTTVSVPAAYSDLFPYWVELDHEDKGVITVQFLTDDYGIPPRHSGYIYISNDDPSSLRDIIQYSDLAFFRVAPNWYEWAD